MKYLLFSLLLITSFNLVAQVKDTVVLTNYISDTISIATFKKRPDNFLGKILYDLTPKKLKYEIGPKQVFNEKEDTIIVLKDTSISSRFLLPESNNFLQYEKYTKSSNYLSEYQWDSLKHIAFFPPHETTDSLTKIVYGFHPFWMGSAYKSYYFSLLTRVAYFSYNIDENNGLATEEFNWANSDIVSYAHKQGCKVDLTVTCFGQQKTEKFLTNTKAQITFIQNITEQLSKKNGDGINLNFEEIQGKYITNFTAFIKSLSLALKKANPEYYFSICLPAIDWSGVYSIDEIASSVDLFILMGYDFSGDNSKYAGPNAPLYSNSGGLNISNSIKTWIEKGVSPSKLVLCVPYFGNEWNTQDAVIPSQAIAFNGSVTYREFASKYRDTYKSYFDSVSSSMYTIFRRDSTWIQLWYDDEPSLSQKYDFVNNQKLGGVAIWALGYDNGFPSLWNLLKRKFTVNQVLLSQKNNMSKSQAFETLTKKIDFNESTTSPSGPTLKLDEIKHVNRIQISDFFKVFSFIILLLAFFGIIGFIITLFDYNVREVLFSVNFRVIIYFVLVFSLVQFILRIFDILNDKDVLFIIGIILGIGLTILIIRVFSSFNNNQKDLTP